MNLVLVLDAGKMSRLRDIVNDKADALFSKLQAAEDEGNKARAEGLRDSLKLWNEIDEAIRDATPEPVADPYVLPGSSGVPLFEIAADIARTHARAITHQDRAEGRVISPRSVRSNIHD